MRLLLKREWLQWRRCMRIIGLTNSWKKNCFLFFGLCSYKDIQIYSRWLSCHALSAAVTCWTIVFQWDALLCDFYPLKKHTGMLFLTLSTIRHVWSSLVWLWYLEKRNSLFLWLWTRSPPSFYPCPCFISIDSSISHSFPSVSLYPVTHPSSSLFLYGCYFCPLYFSSLLSSACSSL